MVKITQLGVLFVIKLVRRYIDMIVTRWLIPTYTHVGSPGVYVEIQGFFRLYKITDIPESEAQQESTKTKNGYSFQSAGLRVICGG